MKAEVKTKKKKQVVLTLSEKGANQLASALFGEIPFYGFEVKYGNDIPYQVYATIREALED